MNRRLKNNGFSLTEVLLAAGILTVGFIMIAGVLPVGVKLTAMSTERTIGAVAADEALAKIKLLGISDVDQWNKPTPQGLGVDPNMTPVEYCYVQGPVFNPLGGAFAYPSTDISPDVIKYYSSVICRYEMLDLAEDSFQATIFVSRDTAAGSKYHYWDPTVDPPAYPSDGDYPRPVPIPVLPPTDTGLLNYIEVDVSFKNFITDESVLVDGRTGQIMRVQKRNNYTPTTIRVTLEDYLFDTDPLLGPSRYVWVVPPAVESSRYPCVAIYQTKVSFK